MSLTEIFCDVDDFCKVFLPNWERTLLEESQTETKNYKQAFSLSPSEVMTLVIYFHPSRYRDFKSFYIQQVRIYLCKAFPKLTRYNRFVELMKSGLVPLCAYLYSRRVSSRGIAFVDSMPLRVCHNRRINRH